MLAAMNSVPGGTARPICITVHLDDGTDVGIWPSGLIHVDVAAMRAARHDLHGGIWFGPDGTVIENGAQDAYVAAPLKPHVLRAAANAAWRRARFARRVAVQIGKSRGLVHQYEPGTLQALVAEAEGTHRKDGWPKGHIPL